MIQADNYQDLQKTHSNFKMSLENNSLSFDEQIKFKVDNIFKKYDKNLSLKLQENEVQCLMKDALREMGSKDQAVQDKVKLFISRVDKDGDSKISKAQLCQALQNLACK